MPSVSTVPHIVHGEEALDDAWPWQVMIFYNGGYLCGGSLVDGQHVVTAAHCIE